MDYAKKAAPILAVLESQSETLQGEIDQTFHHNKHLTNRFTKDGGGPRHSLSGSGWA